MATVRNWPKADAAGWSAGSTGVGKRLRQLGAAYEAYQDDLAVTVTASGAARRACCRLGRVRMRGRRRR